MTAAKAAQLVRAHLSLPLGDRDWETRGLLLLMQALARMPDLLLPALLEDLGAPAAKTSVRTAAVLSPVSERYHLSEWIKSQRKGGSSGGRSEGAAQPVPPGKE